MLMLCFFWRMHACTALYTVLGGVSLGGPIRVGTAAIRVRGGEKEKGERASRTASGGAAEKTDQASG